VWRAGKRCHTKIIPVGYQYESEITGRQWCLGFRVGVADGHHQHACGWLVLLLRIFRVPILVRCCCCCDSPLPRRSPPRTRLLLCYAHIYALRASSFSHHRSQKSECGHICSSFVSLREKIFARLSFEQNFQERFLSVSVSEWVGGLWVFFLAGLCVCFEWFVWLVRAIIIIMVSSRPTVDFDGTYIRPSYDSGTVFSDHVPRQQWWTSGNSWVR